MIEPVPGVSPAVEGERTVMTVWPSISAYKLGRLMGRAFENRGLGGVLPLNITLGKLIAVACIPIAVPLYLLMRIPRLPLCVCYRLTNRRVVVEEPFGGGEKKSVSLDHFDSIEVEVVSGQGWYHAGNLIFRQGQIETFRLDGVARPETFRQTCMKAQQSFAGVAQARALGVAV